MIFVGTTNNDNKIISFSILKHKKVPNFGYSKYSREKFKFCGSLSCASLRILLRKEAHFLFFRSTDTRYSPTEYKFCHELEVRLRADERACCRVKKTREKRQNRRKKK